MTNHHLKLGPLSLNDIGRITQHLREGERKEEKKDGEGYVQVVIWTQRMYMEMWINLSFELAVTTLLAKLFSKFVKIWGERNN